MDILHNIKRLVRGTACRCTSKTAIALFCCLAVLLQPVMAVAAASGGNDEMTYREYLEEQISEYSRFINSLSLENGALTMYSPVISNTFDVSTLPEIDGVSPEEYTGWRSGTVVPYFSEIAVLGLLKAAPDESRETAAGFIDWYFGKLNTAQSDVNGVDGTVYDYYVFVDPADPSRIVETPRSHDYDSTDSYAACFIRVLREYYRVYGDSSLFEDRREDFDRIVSAMFATYSPDVDLTGAKPDYMVCYLMDNCEVYDGCVAASELYESVFGDRQKAAELSSKARAVANGIEEHLYNGAAGNYYAYCHPNGQCHAPSDWETFYADATCQLYPAIFGLINPEDEREQTLYKTFNEHYKKEGRDWTKLTHGDSYPWATICRAAAVMGDTDSVLAYTDTMYRTYVRRGMPYPIYNSEAGQMMYALAILLESGDLELDTPMGGQDQSSAESKEPATSDEQSHVSSPEGGSNIPLVAAIASAGVILAAVAGYIIVKLSKRPKEEK